MAIALDYIVYVLVLTLIFLLICMAYNFIVGYSGMLSLAHAGFVTIGAYASPILVMDYGVPFPLALLASGALCAVAAILLSKPLKMITEDYFAFATLAFAFLVQAIAVNWREVTRGSLGIPGIPRPVIFGFDTSSDANYLLFVLAVTIICGLVIYRITHSRFGRLAEAIRDDESAAKTLGKDTYAVKMKVFAISAFFAGISGSMASHFLRIVTPTSYDITLLVLYLSAIIIGGLASMKGPLVGTAIIMLIPEGLRFLSIEPSAAGPLRLIILSIIVIVVLLYRPMGAFGRVDLYGTKR